MKKSHYRDYATEAFRLYARLGSSAKYKMAIWNEAIEKQAQRQEGDKSISYPSEAAIIRAEKAVENAFAIIADLESVEYTLDALKTDEVKAIKMVYMTEPYTDIERNEISERVHKASLMIPASERSIYTWLSRARDLFAEKRGLRIS